MTFMFENLDVYKKAIELIEQICILSRNFKPKVSYKIIDQLQRAALSIPLNIAEANGRLHQKEKKQFYRTARGSLFECVPLLRICERLEYITEKQYNYLYFLAEDIGKMLHGLIKSVEK